MDDGKEYTQNFLYAVQGVSGGLMQEVLQSMTGDLMKQERFMQCMICQRKADCALSGKAEPKDNPKTGMCSRLLLPGETRSVGETRGRKKGTGNSKKAKRPKNINKKEPDPLQQWLKDMDKQKKKKKG